jgi:hypothetical protein|tara:strand:- start:125 stop:511 length:387 start_codon:yes stop_codon:yes gene_type:complete
MAIIYTNQSSGAIRRLRNKKPTKAYKEALKNHIKYLKKLGFNCDDNGRIQLTTSGGYYLDIAERTMPEPREKTLSDVPMSNKIGAGGTKPDNSWKIEASKNFTIVPAYNKGPYMVVNKSDLKTAGRKV